MSFVASETTLRFPLVPFITGFLWTTFPLWLGQGSADAGLFVFPAPAVSGYSNYWLMSTQLLPSVKVTKGGSTYILTPQFDAAYGGWVYWSLGGMPALFYSVELSSWVLLLTGQGIPVGAAPQEVWLWTDPLNHSSGGAYSGDVFWTPASGASWPADLSSTMSFNERGHNRGTSQGAFNGTAATIQLSWDFWLGPTGNVMPGVYTPCGNASGNKKVGLPQWKSSDGSTFYTQSLTKPDSTHYSYGVVVWNATAGKYILGTWVADTDPNASSSTGWWESSSAPTAGSDWTLTFNKPASSSATGSNKTLSWDKYVTGSNSLSTYHFDFAKWVRK